MQSIASKATPVPTNIKVQAQASAFATATRVAPKPSMVPASKLPYTVTKNRDFVIMSASNQEPFLGGNKVPETGFQSSMNMQPSNFNMQPTNLQGTGSSLNKYGSSKLPASSAGFTGSSQYNTAGV